MPTLESSEVLQTLVLTTLLLCRIMSLCSLRLGQKERALAWANQAYSTEQSKKSLFSLFSAELELVAPQSSERITDIIKRLKDRDDFEVLDLIALGKAAQNGGPANQTAVLEILDELCTLALQNPENAFAVPIGVLLQSTAQLAYTCLLQGGSTKDPLRSGASFAKKFENYARMLLESSTNTPKDALHPPSVFEWFYAMR